MNLSRSWAQFWTGLNPVPEAIRTLLGSRFFWFALLLAFASGLGRNVLGGFGTTLGILLAYEVAKQLGVTAAYGEKGTDGKRMLRRPEHLMAGQRVLIVDDVLTTGGSIRECMELVESIGATLCGVGVVVDRSGGKLDFGAPLAATLSINAVSYAEDELPAELAAIPITRPGSTGKK